MSTVRINVNVDKETKESAEKIFKALGLNMSTAINMFLKRSLLERGLPFPVDLNVPNNETIAAINEGKEILANPDKYPSYDNMDDLRKALEI